MKQALYVMIGGFLGAGKSTALGKLAEHLTSQGLRVGLITNDQGTGLVDTVQLRSKGFNVEEIAGGCFCCRFHSLAAAAEKLRTETRPDVFLAEPVGSCTDLVATVSYPLRRIYGDAFRIAPLSVVLDSVRARRVLGLDTIKTFSPKVLYVYRKQLEEADFIVMNKTDLLDAPSREELRGALEREYRRAAVLEVSARGGEGLSAWFDRILGEEMPPGKSMEVDYDVYAEGEALLGWLNGTLRLSGSEEVDGNALLQELAAALHRRLCEAEAEVGHLKMTLSPDGGPGEVAVINLVRLDRVPELAQMVSGPVRGAEIIVNLRAEADPAVLRRLLEEEVGRRPVPEGSKLVIEHLESFRPGRPIPTHRIEISS
ncbi:MAG TPA: GTP-binding protein [Planctomycetota bacterium]|nr:GTP-binding protein [Planctomycetota bacterium]